MSGMMGGVFDYYKKYLAYKNLKAKEHSELSGLSNSLNEANNNLKITQEQAPLVPRQAAEDYAARGVGQSTFGAGMGDQWAATPPPQQVMVDPHTGAAPNPSGVGRYVQPVDATPAPTSGTANGVAQPVGTGLQRARDLSNSMISNATSSQAAAQDALNQYKKTIKNNRHMFYTDVAEAWVSLIASMYM